MLEVYIENENCYKKPTYNNEGRKKKRDRCTTEASVFNYNYFILN